MVLHPANSCSVCDGEQVSPLIVVEVVAMHSHMPMSPADSHDVLSLDCFERYSADTKKQLMTWRMHNSATTRSLNDEFIQTLCWSAMKRPHHDTALRPYMLILIFTTLSEPLLVCYNMQDLSLRPVPSLEVNHAHIARCNKRPTPMDDRLQPVPKHLHTSSAHSTPRR